MVRDLVVDMSQFYQQYSKVQPYLVNNEAPPAQERLRSPEDREKIDGLYECICAPVALLRARRFGGIRISSLARQDCCRLTALADSRDTDTEQRLANLDDPFSVFRCRGIMNCVSVCPKG